MGVFVLMMIGLACVAYASGSWVYLVSTQNWQEVKIKMLESGIEVRVDSAGFYRKHWYCPAVSYEYEIDGVVRQSKCISRDKRSVWFSTESEAKSYLQQILNQKIAFASVSHPHKVVIMKGCASRRKEHFLVIVLAGVLLIFGGCLIAMIG